MDLDSSFFMIRIQIFNDAKSSDSHAHVLALTSSLKLKTEYLSLTSKQIRDGFCFKVSHLGLLPLLTIISFFLNSSSAFGMPPATGSTNIFGQPQQQTGQQQSNLFSGFGQNQQQNQPQPSTTGGLFGSTTQSQPNAGGLFGSTTQSQPTTGLFGSTAQSQPTTGGLFGSTTQSQGTTGGLFGSTQPQAGGSLFGNAHQQQQQQQQQTGLFGSNTTSTSNPLQPQATLPANAFGASTTTGGGFGGSTLFGSKQPQQQQQWQ